MKTNNANALYESFYNNIILYTCVQSPSFLNEKKDIYRLTQNL